MANYWSLYRGYGFLEITFVVGKHRHIFTGPVCRWVNAVHWIGRKARKGDVPLELAHEAAEMVARVFAGREATDAKT